MNKNKHHKDVITYGFSDLRDILIKDRSFDAQTCFFGYVSVTFLYANTHIVKNTEQEETSG